MGWLVVSGRSKGLTVPLCSLSFLKTVGVERDSRPLSRVQITYVTGFVFIKSFKYFKADVLCSLLALMCGRKVAEHLLLMFLNVML